MSEGKLKILEQGGGGTPTGAEAPAFCADYRGVEAPLFHGAVLALGG
jgi:hypothetical protein